MGDEVNSYDSPFHNASPEDSQEAPHDILWMPEGDMDRASKIAYTFINEDGPVHASAPYLRSTISIDQGVHFRMFPSSRGHKLLRFDSKAEHDLIMDISPIIHDGAHVSLEWSEESPNPFIIDLSWLVALSATNFLEEQWMESGIPRLSQDQDSCGG